MLLNSINIELSMSRFLIKNRFNGNVIQSNDFENVVVCQMKEGKCQMNENDYIFSTFDTINEVNEFVDEYYNK